MVDKKDDDAKIAKTDDDILSQARKHYKACQDADGDNKIAALDDLRFLTGDQWPAKARAAREFDGRPCLTINSLPTYLHQVTNDQRQNRPSIKVHPVDSNADIETAKIEQGMIRHIEYDSNADVAYDRAVNSAAAIGFGYWRLVTEYENETSFNQKIVYKSIRNPLSVKIDPLSTEPDGSDMQFAFIECVMSREDFRRQYPEANASNADLFNDGMQQYAGWVSEMTVLVCEYYCIKKTEEDVVLLSNGESGFKSDLMQLPEGVTIVKTRKGERSRVMWYKITGADVLESAEIKCKWIPIFPVYGDEVDIEGKVIRSGIIRHAKDPAQMYNVMMTSATEEVALRPKSPFIMAEGQEEGHEEEFAQANNRSFPYLTYKPITIDGTLAPPPQRQPMADIPSGMLAMAMHAADNVKKTTGLFDASLGARGSATSGKQEIAQQREGDMANFHYFDGLIRTIRHCGRCIACMIPHYYDTERVVKILGEDDAAQFAEINKPNIIGEKSEDGRVRQFLNDVTAGSYDITVSAGPSYSTLRQEAAEGMADNMSKNPALWGVIGDLYIKNQDWPGADEMAERIKKTIDPKLIADEGKEGKGEVIQTPRGPLPVQQVPQVLAQLEQQVAQMAEALEKAEVEKQALEQAELEIKRRDVEVKAFEAETARMEAERQAENDRLKAMAEQSQADADLLASGADAIRAKIEAGAIQQAPSIEDIAQLVQELRPPPPKSMTIKAPSGQVYSVDLGGA